MRSFLATIVFCFFALFLRAQDVWLHPNEGQWDNEIKYAVELTNGYLYVDGKGFTFSLNDAQDHRHAKHSQAEHDEIGCQVIKSHFIGSNWTGQKVEGKKSKFYRNYYLGQESSRWRTNVASVQSTTLKNFYNGIDMLLEGEDSKLKYSFVVSPGVNPAVIVSKIDGADQVYLSEGNLIIRTRFGEIREEAPKAWVESEGRKEDIKVEFVVKGNQLSYHFPEGYPTNKTLVIDPYLVFSTFTGATADNWGMTATPDSQGNLYGGGIVFAGGGTYPTITGSFDVSFNGGSNYTYNANGGTYNMSGFDVAISKFNANGTDLIYSTFLGGTGNEAPHSLVTDENDELYVFGVTGSTDFPTTPGCFDASFNSGPIVAENELGYNGADIYVTHFNVAGSALVGSTYIGGSGTDGINIGALNYNYGDPFRGEIIVKNGFVYVSSTTASTNFPTLGASQGSLNGPQDAVVFKMNTGLTALAWSTYFGGSGLESGNSVQLASNGNVFVTGGTNSSNLSLNSGNDLTFNGGISDGYLVKFQGNTSLIMSGTYMGLADYDQAYFVQLDVNNEVYIYGQSESSWAISPGVYGNPNSGQFIRKYTNNLQTILWTTMIGAGTGHPEISPTAFLVSDCFDIYISGWGGIVNSSNGNQAIFSTSSGFPVTFDAYQATTNGSNFYIAVLEQDAANLKYGTYMGGTNSSYNHVDGGTSRFDKSGRIYHAVCGACGSQDYGFTSTPGVWSPTNNSTNCNLAAFKFELNEIEAIVSQPQSYICLPDPVVFSNNSVNGNTYFWDFGDNTTSTAVNPSHVYPGPGTYTVTLVVSDSNNCFTPDSVELEVVIGDFEGGVVQPTTGICPGGSYQLEAFGGAEYLWSPANVLDDPTSSTPTATIFATTTFEVIISDSCGVDTVNVTLQVFVVDPQVSPDTSVCIGGSVQLFASGGGTYAWTPVNTLDNPTISNPTATPTVNTTYTVAITSPDGCIDIDSVYVGVFYDPPISVLPDTVEVCLGSSVQIQASGGDTYSWSPNYEITPVSGPIVSVSPDMDFLYYCDLFNACGTDRDSVFVDVLQATINAGNDTIVCPGRTAQLWVSGGVSYVWSPPFSVNNPTNDTVIVTPPQPTTYVVVGTDFQGCTDTADVFVDLYPQPFIQTYPDVYAMYGDEIILGAVSSTSGQYVWSPAEYLSCVSCANPTAMPNMNMTYTVTYTDINGCTASDIMSIYYDPLLYIPNTFTPNDDESNQGFRVVASNVKSYELWIFDRWGELIYTMNTFEDYWDGSYKGLKCQDGTYVWKIEYVDFLDKKYQQTGHVNLLR